MDQLLLQALEEQSLQQAQVVPLQLLTPKHLLQSQPLFSLLELEEEPTRPTRGLEEPP
jgi:hypothetical protein